MYVDPSIIDRLNNGTEAESNDWKNERKQKKKKNFREINFLYQFLLNFR